MTNSDMKKEPEQVTEEDFKNSNNENRRYIFGVVQRDLSVYAETLKSVLWLYGSIKDGNREVSEEMKKALRATIKELSKAINEFVDEKN